MKYAELYKTTIDNGGLTVRVNDNIIPIKGFAVARAGVIIDIDDTEAFDVSVVRVVSSTDAEYLGTWVHEGQIYIDPVDVFASKDFALGVAFATGQLAIYDIAAGKEIAIKRKKG